MRLIDADKLIKELHNAAACDAKEWAYAQGWENAMQEAIRITEEAPINNKHNAKCGTCYYSKPTTFGKSNGYVECTNQEHIQKFCKRPISLQRQKTTPACKSYKEMSGTIKISEGVNENAQNYNTACADHKKE